MFGSVCLGAGSNCKLRKSLEIRGICLQRILHEFIDFHNSCLVTTAVAVVRSREDSNHIPFMRPIVSIHHQLMSSWYQFQIVCMVKLFRDILSERIAGTSWWDTPTASIVRVWPQEIANRSMINSLRRVPISLLTLHEVLPELCRAVWSDQGCRLMVRDLHEDRRFDLQQRQSMEGNQKALWTASTRWHYRISSGIHRRNHTYQY